MEPLNNPIEVGMRTLVLLSASFPRPLDVPQIAHLDDAMLHSGDMGGPPSLHPTLPAGPGELAMKRRLIKQGLIVLLRADLAEVEATEQGLVYHASEEGGAFVDLLETPYVVTLRNRATWIVTAHDAARPNVREATRAITDRWAHAFNSPLTDPGTNHE
ncbi:threonine transporter [Streptomyces sp. SL13]|uniref:Threonine transporter n=1 Tax=Streptantibioticus silvisoli TaxID=2705255 RepID=A0AA90H3N8_9ACTN|nr:ABC-three component system middle component 2 [Streptantibioticus silvisoli]MDI5973518.1 threonine transporter [Streptantibioticus silvisoli]